LEPGPPLGFRPGEAARDTAQQPIDRRA